MKLFRTLKLFYDKMGWNLASKLIKKEVNWEKLSKKNLLIRLLNELKKENWVEVAVLSMLLWGEVEHEDERKLLHTNGI